MKFGFVFTVLAAVVTVRCGGEVSTTGGSGTNPPGSTSDQPFTVTPEPPGANCPAGGVVITTATTTSYVCNGTNGSDGTNGADGTNGTNGTDGATPTVVAEPPGSNCVAGGVLVTTAASAFYICNGVDGANGTNGTDGTNGTNGTNGADGKTYVITNEAPGINCTNGGVRVEAVDGVHFVCNGAQDTGLCAPMSSGAQTSMYAAWTGQRQGAIHGSVAVKGYENTISALGFCYSQRAQLDPSSGGVVAAHTNQAPFILFLAYDPRPFVMLSEMWATSEIGTRLQLDVLTRSIVGGISTQVDTNQIKFTNTTIVGMRQYDAPQAVIEVAFDFATITWTEPNDTSAGTYTNVPASFTPPMLVSDACDVVPAADRPAGQLYLAGGAQLKGSVTAKGHENTVQLYQTCHTLETFANAPQHFVMMVIKRPDAASITLRNAMANGTVFTRLDIQDYRPSLTGAEQLELTTSLANAQVADIEIVPSADTGVDYYERVSFAYQKITWTAAQGGITATDTWR